MKEYFGLFLNRGHDVRVAMARGTNCNTRIEVQKSIAVHVFNNGAPSPIGDYGRGSWATLRHIPPVIFDHLTCFRSWELCNNFWKFVVHSCQLFFRYERSDEYI